MTIYKENLILIELGESAVNNLGNFSITQESWFQIVFTTPGVKKVLVIFEDVFGQYFSVIFSLVVNSCMYTLEITFPDGFVMIM